jgi:Gram-negative porin
VTGTLSAVRTACATVVLTLCVSAFSPGARAEKILATDGDWVIFTDGRVGAFLSYVHGDGRPIDLYSPDGNLFRDVKGGGYDPAATARDPLVGGAAGQLTQGTIDDMRVRSGFIANTLGMGVRGPMGYSTVTGYIQIWALAETDGRTKNRPNIVDVRQAYVRVEGNWGSFLAGRSRALFSRGATDIDVLYAHRYGVGSPGSLDLNGPTAGHIGFGVLGSGFAPGLVYATPPFQGLQLTVGAYDPIQIPAGAWTRTKWARPESELTLERPLGQIGKYVLFANGAFQKLYHDGKPDSDSATAVGFGYGGRLEVGPARLGVAGHYGKGLGLTYALESSDANTDPENRIRTFDGYYVQTQLVLGRWDLSTGWGVSRVFLNAADKVTVPNAGADPATTDPTMRHVPHSVIKYQMGNSAGVVFHLKPWFHIDLDLFRAHFAWYEGETQTVYIANTGVTMTW